MNEKLTIKSDDYELSVWDQLSCHLGIIESHVKDFFYWNRRTLEKAISEGYLRVGYWCPQPTGSAMEFLKSAEQLEGLTPRQTRNHFASVLSMLRHSQGMHGKCYRIEITRFKTPEEEPALHLCAAGNVQEADFAIEMERIQALYDAVPVPVAHKAEDVLIIRCPEPFEEVRQELAEKDRENAANADPAEVARQQVRNAAMRQAGYYVKPETLLERFDLAIKRRFVDDFNHLDWYRCFLYHESNWNFGFTRQCKRTADGEWENIDHGGLIFDQAEQDWSSHT